MVGKAVLGLAVVVLMIPCVAQAERVLTFEPTPSDMYDLDHYKAYGWGIEVVLNPGERVIEAELTMYDIRNWDSNPNDLYISLLDWIEPGVQVFSDGAGGGDYFTSFTGDHISLEHYEDLSDSAQTIVYTFTEDELEVLNTYLADESIGIGMDPDCHFYNNGIELRLTTPEPASLVLLGMAIPAVLRRRPR